MIKARYSKLTLTENKAMRKLANRPVLRVYVNDDESPDVLIEAEHQGKDAPYAGVWLTFSQARRLAGWLAAKVNRVGRQVRGSKLTKIAKGFDRMDMPQIPKGTC